MDQGAKVQRVQKGLCRILRSMVSASLPREKGLRSVTPLPRVSRVHVQNHAPINVFTVARCAWDNIPTHNVQRVERAAVEKVVVLANDVWIKAWKNAVFMSRRRMRAMHFRALISLCKARIRTM